MLIVLPLGLCFLPAFVLAGLVPVIVAVLGDVLSLDGEESHMRRLIARLRRDDGMNTAEYAVGTLAAVAFAGLLLKVLTSDTVQNALAAIVQRALK